MLSGKWFGREPALVIQTISALLAMLIGFGIPGLNDNLAGAVTAVLTAAASVWVAIHTQPVAPTVFTGLITAAATLLATFGLNFTQQQVSLVAMGVTALMALVLRAQVTPVHDPEPVR